MVFPAQYGAGSARCLRPILLKLMMPSPDLPTWFRDASLRLGLSIALLLSAGVPAGAQTRLQAAPEVASGRTQNAQVQTDIDMAVTANPLASKVAADMLARGGSAVDAAIAAQMVLNVVEPQSSGIGGGAFMLVHNDRSRRLRVFDGREISPAGLAPDVFLKPDGKRLGFLEAVGSGLSVGVPGVLRMLDLAHRGGGQLPWPELFRPAIDLAENGFPISPRLYTSILAARDRIAAQPAAAAYFLTRSGKAKPAGTVLRNPELAATFREIAEHGAEVFYRGPIAQAIVEAISSHPSRPGVMTIEDLRGYRALEREPLCGEYRRYRICGMPAPSSGAITTLQTLGILESFDLSVTQPGEARAVHLITEAQRLAYADRARYIADPAFVTVPVQGLLSQAYLAERARLISEESSLGAAPAGTPPGAPISGSDRSTGLPATSHLSIVDQSGNAVSLTSSIEHAFGSLIMVKGFLLNNQLTDFSFAPTDEHGDPIANRIEPGKRPRSSMAPTMVFDRQGNLEAVIGSPGGAAIIHYVTQTLIGLIDWRLGVQDAVSAPHFGAMTTATTTLEADTPIADLREQLTALGHKIAVAPLTSGLHAIVFNGVRANGQTGGLASGFERSRWAGAADPRREGAVAGR